MTLERYIFENGSPFAKKLSEQILDIASRMVHKLLKTAAADIDRNQLWDKYAVGDKPKDQNPCNYGCIEEVSELCSLSLNLTLFALDPRLMEMLTNEVKDIGLDIPDLVECMIKDQHVHHYHLFEATDDNRKTYLFYMNQWNVFLLLEVDQEETLAACSFIGLNGTGVEEQVIRSSVMAAVQSFATLTLTWIWSAT